MDDKPKKRGRPKGSKNKPKHPFGNDICIINIPRKLYYMNIVGALEQLGMKLKPDDLELIQESCIGSREEYFSVPMMDIHPETLAEVWLDWVGLGYDGKKLVKLETGE